MAILRTFLMSMGLVAPAGDLKPAAGLPRRGGCTTKRLACGEPFFIFFLSFVYQTKERTKEKFTSVVFLFPLKLPKNWEPRKPALLCKAKSRLFFQFFTKFFGKNKGDIFSSRGEYLKPPAGATSPIDIKNVRRIAIQNTTETSCP